MKHSYSVTGSDNDKYVLNAEITDCNDGVKWYLLRRGDEPMVFSQYVFPIEIIRSVIENIEKGNGIPNKLWAAIFRWMNVREDIKSYGRDPDDYNAVSWYQRYKEIRFEL